MSLSTTNQITSAVQFDNNNFSFVNTYGTMIQNRPYSRGFKNFKLGRDTRDAFLYKALSAVSDELGNILYLNVRKYIDFVSDVDVCKIKSLKSMLQLFGFNKTVFDSIDNLPKELVDLINVLSISKKYLLRDGVVTKELMQSLMQSDGLYFTDEDEAVYFDEYKINFRKYFQNNSYTLSASYGCVDSKNCSISKLNGIYVYDGKSLSDYSDAEDWIDEQTFSRLSSLDVYRNSNGYFAVCEDSYDLMIYNNEYQPILKVDKSYIKDELTANGSTSTVKIQELTYPGERFQEYEGDAQFIDKNISQSVDVIFRNLDYTEDVECIDNDKYLSYLSTLYKTFIRGQILTKYNAEFSVNKHRTSVYAYPYLGNMYFDDDIKQSKQLYNGFDGTDNDILSIKMFNHVPKSFNESKIVDDIDEGLDSLENYSGAQLSILQIEINNRAAPLDYNKIGIVGNTSKQLQTRYSYYREKKVAEYANFVDNYYSTIYANPKIYDFDSNYYVIQNQGRISTVIDQNINLNKINPENDVDPTGEMIGTVALYLAKFTQYIAKIREKIKLQTQKNYMKGTNLLMIYVINEYLNEYAAHNKQFFESDDRLLSIYNALDGHQFADKDSEYTIEIDEFYDKTNYFNISTQTSLSSTKMYADDVNDRYWELTSVEHPVMMSADGLYYKQSDIEKLYLSTLNMQDLLGGSADPMSNRKLAAFLSSIYDLGANDSFVYDLYGDPQLSIFSTMLEDKSHAAELYERLIALSSAYENFNSIYLSAGDYKYPNDTISNQVSNVTETYIFKNLSDAYLKDVSAVYNKHIRTLNSISNDVITLSSDYNDFISGKYSFYYKKSNCKYCYSDYDLDAGLYQHVYYIGNDMYDNPDMNLYEHLYQLQQYSSEQNIHNFALSDTIEYIREGFYSIRSSLQSNVVQPLIISGFIDYDPLTLDDKLQYVYDYLNDYIKDRKDILKNQLTSLQQQAANLKTQYETLNNTFTNAVASYSDNDDGYKLGDSQITAVSLVQNSSASGDLWTRADKDAIPKNDKYTWLYCKYNGRWYCSKHGSFPIEVSSITPYNPEDSLLDRIDQLVEYMNTPTAFEKNDEDDVIYYTGLLNEGTQAVCDSIKQGVEEIQKAFDSLCTQANALYGIDADEFASVELYDQILDMIAALTAVDQSLFDSDDIVVSYSKYKKLVLQLSSDYLPIKQAYTSIFTDVEQSEYLVEYYPNTDLTQENIESLERYMKSKDADNLQQITAEISKFIEDDFQKILSKKDNLEQNINDDGVRVTYTTSNAIEQSIEHIYDALIADVGNKVRVALSKIYDEQYKVNQYLDSILNEISASINDVVNFDVCVKQKLSELNFFDHKIYKSWVDLFLTYGGRSFCYDPYYNMRNVTHPSYQIHPYMWNFVKKVQGDSLIGAGFKSKIVTELIDGQSLDKLKGFIGEFGQTIDTWRNYTKGAIDYSGYITRWEQSEHSSPNTGMFNQIVDYEGAFYPPALKDYLASPNACISSVYYKKTKFNIQLDLEDALTSDMSAYVKTDSKGIVSSNTFYNYLSSTLNSYCISNNVKTLIDSKVNGSALSDLQIYDVLQAASDGIPYTFFENYYKHLNLKDTQYQFIGLQMSEYYDAIKDITSPKHLTAQYDIYKYGLDIHKNSYILFKKYDYSMLDQHEDMTFRQRRNTLGQMWIRMAHTPLAFPAFSGERPQYYIKHPSMISTAIMKLITLKADGIEYTDKYKTTVKRINNDMCYFYDFELTPNKFAISYITFNGDFDRLGNFYKQFELSWVVSDTVNYFYDIDDDIELLAFKNDAANNIDYIDFRPSNGLIAAYRNMHSIADQKALAEGVRYPSLVSYYVHDFNCIDFVYVYKKYQKIVDDEGDVHYSIRVSGKDDNVNEYTEYYHDQKPAFFIVQVKNGVNVKAFPESGAEEIAAFAQLGKYPYDHNVCAGYDKNTRNLVLAITTANEDYMKKVVTETSKHCIDFEYNTEGPVIDDPVAIEMNSHDIFNQAITLVNYKRKLSEIQYVNCYDYNINADMSYLPSYPGISGESQLYKKYNGSQFYNIELLGMSKDIEQLIKLVNPNPNPYITYDSIISSSEFGRVYEDFVREDDKTFMMFKNPSLNDNMPTSEDSSYTAYKDIINHCFVLTYNLHNIKPYTVKDIQHMNLFIFNQEKLGKNPYYAGKLSALTDETDLVYNDKIEDDNNAESQIHASSNSIKFTVTGTHDKVGTRSIQDTNHIDNIERVTAQLILTEADDEGSSSSGSSSESGTDYEFSFVEFENTDFFSWGIIWNSVQYHKLTKNDYYDYWKSLNLDPSKLANAQIVLKFYYDNSAPYVYVPANSINIALYNTHDLTLFKYYHMLDAHGAVNCKYLSSILSADDVDNYSWGVVYDKTDIEGNDLSDLMRSYYINEYGGKTYLSDVELSNYDALSDVYILQGNKRLSFKYDEELRFDLSNDLYYYPTLNINYPLRAADFVFHGSAFSLKETENANILSNIFNEYNMFIIDLDRPEDILSSIGKVDIQYIYNDVNDVRAFEDYLSAGDDGELNYTKYDTVDPRAFQFVHFVSETGVQSADIDIPQAEVGNKSLEQFLNYCYTEVSGLCPTKSEELTADYSSQYVSITPAADNCDISKQLKLYVNYRRNRDDSNKIDLYFNYFNYFDSPYVKIENGNQLLLDTIPNTYLKLEPGEDGILDIVLQFKFYISDVLYGYKNVKVLSYRIFNLSDDKPKFMVQKLFQCAPGEQTYSAKEGFIKFNIEAHDVDLDAEPPAQNFNYDLFLNIATNKTLKKAEFYIEYPDAVLQPLKNSDGSYIAGNGYSIISDDSIAGLLHVKITNLDMQNYQIQFKSSRRADMLDNYANKTYLFSVLDPDIEIKEDGKLSVELGSGSFKLSKLSLISRNPKLLVSKKEDIKNNVVGWLTTIDIHNRLVLLN